MAGNIASKDTVETRKLQNHISWWVSSYTTTIAIIGLIFALVAFTDLPQDWQGLLFFVVLAIGAELWSVELFMTTRGSRVSVSSIICIASIITFGPLAGALTHMAAGIVSPLPTLLAGRKQGSKQTSWLRRAAFNMGMWIIAATAAGVAYILAGGSVGNIALVTNIVPLIIAASVDVVVNLFILLGVLALQTQQKPWQIWRDSYQWSMPISILAGVIGAGALALAYEMFSFLGLLVFWVPVLATSYSFRLYVKHTKMYVNKLEEMNRTLDEANVGLLETLGAVIDADDAYTYGHSKQVAEYAGALSAEMGLSQEEQATIVKAALIHDVGKVGIADSIISKNGPLTDEEFAVMKRHPDIGADIVGRMRGLHHLVPLVRHHHERWDGRGYPGQLAGTAIPLGARVLALADSLDAMCSDRPYRPGMPFQQVVERVRSCSGIQFDPDVVTAFLRIVDEKGATFLKNSAAEIDTTMPTKVGAGGDGNRYLKRSMISSSE